MEPTGRGCRRGKRALKQDNLEALNGVRDQLMEALSVAGQPRIDKTIATVRASRHLA